MTVERVLTGFRGWSSLTPCPITHFGRESRNINFARGFPWPDLGYKITRQISTGTTGKAAGSWTHVHTTGGEYPFYYFNTALYKETGSAATSIAGSLTEVYAPSVTHFANPAGVSVFLNGTNSQAQALRVESGALVAVALDMDKPGGSFSAANGTSGSLVNGTYYVRITQIDDTGATVVESASTAAVPHVLAGANDEIVLDLTSTTYATRATKYRVYLSTTTDTLAAYFQTGADTAKATTSFSITTSTAGTALQSRNGYPRTATMPLTGARFGCAHLGRLFIASPTSNLVYWSERDAPNHWYSTNGIADTEGAWNGPVTGLGSAEDGLYVFTATAIYRIAGDFARDSSYRPNARVELVETGLGCVSHASIVPVPGYGLCFMSQFGPCAILGGRVMRLGQEHVRDFLSFLDFPYAQRWVGAYDPEWNHYCLAVSRRTNASRAFDGASVAGRNDLILRWAVTTGEYSCPVPIEAVHLSLRQNTASIGDTGTKMSLMAMGPHASALLLNFGYAYGISDGVATSTDYDGKLASASTTTSATFTRTAGATDDLQGFGLTLYYPSGDSNYPGVVVQRVISGNTYSGGNVVLSWNGALTVPSGTNWTARLTGKLVEAEVLRGLPVDANPKATTRIVKVTALLADVVGAERRA